MSTPLIQARNLTKTYPGATPVHALREVSFAIEAGEMTAILGRSGSGKSTLLHVLGGLDHLDQGELQVDGLPIHTLSRENLAAYRATRIGFVFQAFHLQAGMTAWENASLPLVFLGKGRKERKARALEMLERVGLAERADHRPNMLSGGEMQRVALARALMTDPPIILGDEPTGNLDTNTAAVILDLLEDCHQRGSTVLIVTHDEELASQRCKRILRMGDGRLLSDTKAQVTA